MKPLKPRKNAQLKFDTFDGHVMVNFIDPNLQDIILTVSSASLITQKRFWDHLKKSHSLGWTPYQYPGHGYSCLGPDTPLAMRAFLLLASDVGCRQS
jgi:hypothetical protein